MVLGKSGALLQIGDMLLSSPALQCSMSVIRKSGDAGKPPAATNVAHNQVTRTGEREPNYFMIMLKLKHTYNAQDSSCLIANVSLPPS